MTKPPIPIFNYPATNTRLSALIGNANTQKSKIADEFNAFFTKSTGFLTGRNAPPAGKLYVFKSADEKAAADKEIDFFRGIADAISKLLAA